MLAKDRSLWRGVDLTNVLIRPLSLVHVQSVLDRGVQAARFARCAFAEGELMFSQKLSLRYLDMSCCDTTAEQLNAILIANNHSLIKLSIENCNINQDTFDLLCKTHTKLQVLNMALCKVSEPTVNFRHPLSPIMKELNLSWILCDDEIQWNIHGAIDFLPENIERLNMSGYRSIHDETLQDVTLRCGQLVELDISDCSFLTSDCLEYIASDLLALRCLSISRCHLMINFEPITRMRSLETINCYGLDLEQALCAIPELVINDSPFSTVARPTVGNRRSTIWTIRLQ